MPSATPSHKDFDMAKARFFNAGEMGERISQFPWETTALGPIEYWPPSLLTAVHIMLGSQHPMWIGWGQDNTFLYNDAYIGVLSLAKHPLALGKPAAEVWAEIWDVCGPLSDQVYADGKASFFNDVRLFMSRGKTLEETYYSFSYSPIRNADGEVAGLFCPSAENTGKILSERRLATLSELSSRSLAAKTVDESIESTISALQFNTADIPFAVFYRLQKADSWHTDDFYGMSLTAAEALCPRGPIEADIWDVDIPDVMGIPLGLGDRRIEKALALPIVMAGRHEASGVLLVGTNPCRPLDDDYRNFFALLSIQVTTAIQNALSSEEERMKVRQLAELDRAKTAFFTNISHEFRTPLTLILSPLEELLEAEAELPLDVRDGVERAMRNALRLQKLVNNLLDFSRIEAGRINAQFQRTDLAALTSDIASTFRSLLERADLRFDVDCRPLSQSAFIDREMWEKIVLNLLSNAFKFTLNGRIRVSLKEHDDCAELCVTDSGIGIEDGARAEIFKRFSRVEAKGGRSYEGSGIGLALVQELVRIHGGSITVSSIVNEGSIFKVIIPLGSAHLPADKLVEEESPLSLTRAYLSYTEGEMLEGIPAAREKEEGREDVRILLVDDNEDMRLYLSKILSRHWNVHTAYDGEQALDLMKQLNPTLILTDVMMPKVDGFQLLRAVKNDPVFRETPVIMLSARSGEESRLEGVNSGADDYLVKPFSAKELIARVNNQLERARQRREISENRARNEAYFRMLVDNAPCLLWLSDANGDLTYCNKTWQRFTGRSFENELGRGWTEVIHPQDQAATLNAIRDAVEAQARFSVEFRIKGADGSWRFVTHKAYPRFRDAVYEGHIGSTYDISDHKHAEQEREYALIREKESHSEAERLLSYLVEADRRKDEFLAVLSHELRSPLNVIHGHVELLKLDSSRSTEQRDSLDAIERNVKLQTQLVADLLDVSRIITGKLQLEVAYFEADSIVSSALESVRFAADAKGVNLKTSIQAKMGRMSGDPTRLQQVIWNLLSNAVKFTPTGGTVSLQVSAHHGWMEIVVSDNGQGINVDFLPHVFDRFHQEDSAKNRKYGGLGLGLAIVRHIAEMHGGSVWAESEGKGLGSKFTVMIPAVDVSRLQSVEQAQTAAELPQAECPRIDCSKRPLMGRKILVVDDQDDARLLASKVLSRQGAEIIQAGSAADALVRLRDLDLDAMFCDISMPEMSGLELIQLWRHEEKTRGMDPIPAVAMTAFAGEADRQEALRAGFFFHLPKPVHLAELVRVAVEVTKDRIWCN
jgi:PAS domain S-box-containing protein